ncbi:MULTISPECIES: FUSC family protein [Caballeronia]|uniref:LysR family transcriptional regulator n=1 Tax=Caballeronia zhejiangensis TaxID=871203 RepID=A0A656QDJ0_9BURK|nr:MULTISPECIES: FUSC family protein [Caballeronia]EKS67464.1 LysR family transcriptional regulator [Burkholderia sp. SJ98]KDR26763.1 LysR family transcriptional regulator [Caballeronia zhejiangensis]MDR5789251.1 FUSC family protein [Caballeronia sp. LP003]
MDDEQPIGDAKARLADSSLTIVQALVQRVQAVLAWLDRVDPGTHRRIKGLRLVTAYGLAAALGALQDVTQSVPAGVSVGALAGGFALWASVSEARTTRFESSRDLVTLCVAAAFGAFTFTFFAPMLRETGRGGAELILVTGAFLAGYLKRFGMTGAGVGSQLYIGQLLAYGMDLRPGDSWAILLALLIGMLAAIVPRVLSGPAEHPVVLPALASEPAYGRDAISPAFAMGLQAACGALVVVALNRLFGLAESAWAITACVYVVATSAVGTAERVRRRIYGTLVGVPIGIVCLPLAEHWPLVVWILSAFAMIAYAMALPERYDIACGAFAFVLIVTLAASGVHSLELLTARAWETLLGGALGLIASRVIFPLRVVRA